MNAPNNQLTVTGALSALGTLTQPITFTGGVAAPSLWGGLSVNNTALAPALVNLSYVTLDCGGVITSSSGAQLYADQSVVTLTHSLIRNGDSYGMFASTNARGHSRHAVYQQHPQCHSTQSTPVQSLDEWFKRHR